MASLMEQPTRNWLDLPSDIMVNILNRVGMSDILENAQKVCTSWCRIYKDPAIWQVIYLDFRVQEVMCKLAVDRSRGQLIDFTIVHQNNDDILQYAADRSNQLRRLEIACCPWTLIVGERWTKSLFKFPLLEELSLYQTDISKEGIEVIGRNCPMLKTLKLNRRGSFRVSVNDEKAIAIGKNFHGLRHLELIGDCMSNIGLQVILDGCPHLESLDLRDVS